MSKINWDIDFEGIVLNTLSNHNMENNYHFEKVFALADSDRTLFWLTFQPKKYQQRNAGWKLHISADLHNAEEVLLRSIGVLLKHQACFKLTDSMRFLGELNHSGKYITQSGKFITIYPHDDNHAVALAQELDACTKDLVAPKIITDFQLLPGSIIYYRWGSFTPKYKQTLWGSVLPILEKPNGQWVFDRRDINPIAYEDIFNPFMTEQDFVSFSNVPKVINDRYWKIAALSKSASDEVYLGLDSKQKRRCIIKFGFKDSYLDNNGNNAVTRLQYEANILKKIQGKVKAPKVYDELFDSNDNFILIIEDIAGANLYQKVISNIKNYYLPSEFDIVQLFLQVAEQILLLHQNKIIHADIKLHNFILDEENFIRVIDFNASADEEAQKYIYSCGSNGFATKNRRKGKKPAINDDIYAFGAMLYYYATNTDCHLYQLEFGKIVIPITVLNRNVSAYLNNIITNCLNGEYTSFDEIIHDFKFFNPGQDNFNYDEINTSYFNVKLSHRDNLDNLVKSFVTFLNSSNGKHEGLAWLIDHEIIYDDFRGTAGCLMGLAVYAMKFPNNDINKFLSSKVTYLLNDDDYGYNRIPGLYVGESGRALASLYTGLAINDQTVIDMAVNKLILVNKMSLLGTDIFNGLAGRLRANCIFMQYVDNPEIHNAADCIYEKLISASFLQEENICWHNSKPHSTQDKYELENSIRLGYAHGLAGITDALIDYYLIRRNDDVVKVIQSCLSTLTKHIQIVLQGKGIAWPSEIGKEYTMPLWCTGSIGIAKVFLRAQLHGLYKDSISIADKVINTMPLVMNNTFPMHCHGIIGCLDLLLDYKLITNLNKYDGLLEYYVHILECWLEHFIEAKFSISSSHFEARDYMTGVPGMIAIYTRLASSSVICDPILPEFSKQIINTSNSIIY